MFFLHELERIITLHPSFFGPRMREYLLSRLYEDVEGTCTGQYYIICVVKVNQMSEGRVIPGSGYAEFTIQYQALVWKPFKGETVRTSIPGGMPRKNPDRGRRSMQS
jgi:DNA-directed RNA polymerase II subunit RPB7